MGTHENTKLCDFTSTNNSDFIYTPIAPPAPEATFYEIKPALLKFVMKEQFLGVSTDDAAAHLNNFVELCDGKQCVLTRENDMLPTLKKTKQKIYHFY
jgi:hypothetical protein